VEIRTKEPAESLVYGLDWTSLLAESEIVATSTWSVTPADLTLGTSGKTNTVTTVRLSGGTVGVEYEVQCTVTTTLGNTLVDSFVLVVDDEPAAVVGERYCTVAEARAAGARGSTRDVEAAIVAATSRVDDYTGDRFTPRVMTVVARVGGDGRAMLPYRLLDADSVTEVVDHDGDVTLAASTYRVYSSRFQGDVDAIGVGRSHVGTNILVVGLEPWADTDPWSGGGRLRVTATFGWEQTPVAVSMATAMLAAAATKVDVEPGHTGSTADSTDPEGNVIPVVPPFAVDVDDVPVAERTRTTGSRKADALLAPYRRTRVLSGV
jgi:hypothetical protein